MYYFISKERLLYRLHYMMNALSQLAAEFNLAEPQHIVGGQWMDITIVVVFIQGSQHMMNEDT